MLARYRVELVVLRRSSRFQTTAKSFREFGCSDSISKIACREFVRSHNLTLLVENFDTATIYSTVPSCIINRIRFVLGPERAVREPFALKIPSVMRLAWSDFVLIHLSCGVSLADKTLQYQEGFPLASEVRT